MSDTLRPTVRAPPAGSGPPLELTDPSVPAECGQRRPRAIIDERVTSLSHGRIHLSAPIARTSAIHSDAGAAREIAQIRTNPSAAGSGGVNSGHRGRKMSMSLYRTPAGRIETLFSSPILHLRPNRI